MAGRGQGPDPTAGGPGSRLSKGQKRLNTILRKIPDIRDQLRVAVDDVGPKFDEAAIEAASTSTDPRERNKIATVEREVDVLINLFEELAERGLSEARRRGITAQGSSAWERLVDLGAISKASSDRLLEAKYTRNVLDHAYPPETWRGLHDAVEILLDEVDRYPGKVDRWLRSESLL